LLVRLSGCAHRGKKSRSDDVSSSELVRFKAGVDPDGMLEAVLEGTDFAHTRENEVEYFELYEHTGGQKRYACILATLYDD
jgi:hypothetical protein